MPVERYVNPRKAEWPAAEFVVGNPPFIGTKRMRALLGDGYVDAIRSAWPQIEDSADFVMYWWFKSAERVSRGEARQFGLITTNSLRQNFNRRAVDDFIGPGKPMALAFVIPDHPWVDASDGAAVRISMTVGAREQREGVLATVVKELESADGEVRIELSPAAGAIHADLRIGVDIQRAKPLQSNAGISGMGVALHGAGFILEPDEAAAIRVSGDSVIRGYVGGRDLLQVARERYLIDFSSLSHDEARQVNPAAFQRVIDRVKPERDHNNRTSIRELWWRFGWERPLLRKALVGLQRYIGTTETAKHRVFQFIRGDVLADHMVVCIAVDHPAVLGVLGSRVHVIWSIATGGTLEDRPRYNKNACWDSFPLPDLNSPAIDKVSRLALAVESHRKSRQSAHHGLALTDVYNVLDKLRRNEPLTAKDKVIHDQGLVSVLRELHDDLDRAVFAAYGWEDLGERLVGKPGATTPWPEKTAEQAEAEEELLARLVALNAERAAEEGRGIVRWLRPEFQNPQATGVRRRRRRCRSPNLRWMGGGPGWGASRRTRRSHNAGEARTGCGCGSTRCGGRGARAAPIGGAATGDAAAGDAAATDDRIPWPKTAPEQARAVAELLAATRSPLSIDNIAARFTARGRWRDRLPQLLDTLVALGRARSEDGRWWAA